MKRKPMGSKKFKSEMVRLNRPTTKRAVTGHRKEYIQLGDGYQMHHYLRMDGGYTVYILYRYSMLESFRYEKEVKIDNVIEDIKEKVKKYKEENKI